MKPALIMKGLFSLLAVCSVAHATVSPDRTRIIFNETDKSVTIKLTNQNKALPYLAQSWIEDKNSQKRVNLSLRYRRCSALSLESKLRFD